MQKQKNKQKQIQDIVQLIDESYILDTDIKAKKKVLDANKKELKKTALKEGKSMLSGELIDIALSDETKTEIDPKELYTLLSDMGMQNAFWDIISVKIGDAKKRVGDMVLEQIWKQSTKRNSKLTFKKRK